jgi:MerR family mercuric resistance operon transcriptional regulator
VTGGLRSGELAAAAGVGVQTLRYYERRGLIAEPPRTLGGHRVYPPGTVTVLRAIRGAQRLGFTLHEIRGLIGARQRPGGLPARAAGKLAEVEAELAELTAVRDALRAALDAGCADLLTCAEIEHCPLAPTT